MPTPNLSRRTITDAAFRGWGRTLFRRTGLDTIAEELSVSKTALYRYFRSKEEILSEMHREFEKRYYELVVVPTNSSTDRSLEAVAERFFTHMFHFFETHPFHYIFYLRRVMGRESDTSKRSPSIDGAIAAAGIAPKALPSITRYLTVSAVFWMTHHYRKELGHAPTDNTSFEPERHVLSPTRRDIRIKVATDRFIYGFAPSIVDAIDYERIEGIATISPDEIAETSAVFKAIASVVREVGYTAATVGRIAGTLGITKSSLYHHFRNKDEMLSRTIIEEQRRFADVAFRRFRQLETDEERLYALFVLLSNYAVLRPEASIVGNWVRECNIEVQIPPSHVVEIQKSYTFVTDMLIDGTIAGSPEEAFGIFQFIHFLVLRESAEYLRMGYRGLKYRTSIRELFLRVVGGTHDAVDPVEASSRGEITR